jgi:hypothetical protein
MIHTKFIEDIIGLINPIDFDEAAKIDDHSFFEHVYILKILFGKLSVMDCLIITSCVLVGDCVLVIAHSKLLLFAEINV